MARFGRLAGESIVVLEWGISEFSPALFTEEELETLAKPTYEAYGEQVPVTIKSFASYKYANDLDDGSSIWWVPRLEFNVVRPERIKVFNACPQSTKQKSRVPLKTSRPETCILPTSLGSYAT